MNEHNHMFPHTNNLTSHSVYEAVPQNSTYHQHQLIGKMGTSGISKTNRSQSNEPPQNILGKKQQVTQVKKGTNNIISGGGISRNVIDNILQQNLSQPLSQQQFSTNSNRIAKTNLLSSSKPLDSANSTTNGLQSTKKARKLRKNFDMLAHAMKANLINTTQISNHNTTSGGTTQQGKKKSSEGEMLSYGMQEQQQVFQNVIFNNNKAPLSAHNQEVVYGRKQQLSGNNVYETFLNQNQIKSGNAYSQRAASQHSSNQYILGGGSIPAISQQHNTSLYSQISLKESPTKQQKKGAQILVNTSQTRNPSLHMPNHQVLTQGSSLLAYNQPAHHNFSHQTQPLSLPHHDIGKQGSMLKSNHTNERLTKRYGVSGGQSRKSQENILEGSGSQQQPILNINTASDINIYNNSFIVNTAGLNQQSSLGQLTNAKKPSQQSSRSNSIKRGNVQGAYNPASNMKKQLIQGKLINLNSAGAALTNQQQQNLQNLLGLNNEYNTQKVQVRNNSQSRLSATSNDHLQRYNQITEAYTATNFFSNVPAPSSIQGSNLISNVMTNTSQKKMIKLNPNNSNLKKATSQAVSAQGQIFNQQSYTQSFDNMQPFNSSSEHLMLVSSSSLGNNNNLKKQAASSGSRIKFASNQHHKSASGKQVKYSQSQNRLNQQRAGAQVMTEEPSVTSAEQNFSIYSNGNYQQNQSSSPLLNQRVSKAKIQSQQLLSQAKKKVLDKDYKGAVSLLTEALVLDPENMDAKFYRALSQLDSGMHQESINEFREMISNQTHNLQVCYILLSIAYKRANDSQMSLNTLTECISKCPSYPDAYLARGQQYLMQEKLQLALSDFSQYTSLNPTNGMGFVGVGDSNKSLHQWQQAIIAYSKAIQLFKAIEESDPPLVQISQATLKRGLSYFHLRLYQQAMLDFQQVIKGEQTSIKAHFYIGKILSRQYLDGDKLPQQSAKLRQKIQNEAILHFEQVVKYHQSNGGEVYAGNALFEIARLRLHDKDFYEAYFNLKRAIDSNFTSKRLQLYKDFTEGVLYLIKRKIKKGVQILSDLLEVLVNNKDNKDKTQLEDLRHQSFLYRAYGYVAIEKYEYALQDIKSAKKIKKLDAATIYNKLLGKGILRMDHEEYIMATKYFSKASLKFPSNKDPYCLYIISIVRSYSYSHKNMTIDQEEKKERIQKAKNFMDHAIQNCDLKVKVPSLYFFRGLLHFQMHQFYLALKDFNVAIEEEEEPTPSYYLARGRTYACLSILTEAMKDLSIALNLDETMQEAYIYRGKCAYLLGDNNLAFLDFQRLILTDPKNPMVHVYAGNLLMTTGAYQDAIKAFLNADTVERTAVAAFQRARCFCALTDLENAKMQYKIALQLSNNQEEFIQLDSQVLSTLMRVINANQNSQIIQTAIDMLNKQIQLFENNKGGVRSFCKKDCPLNIQIIPNVRRIKIEKLAAARELIAQAQNNPDKPHEVSIATEELLNQSAGSLELDQLEEIIPYSYYFENVFSLEDLYLYRAVFNFYKKDYQSAITDFLNCQSIKLNGGEALKPKTNNEKNNYRSGIATPQESMMAYSRSSTLIFSMNSSKTDLSDVGLCSLNIHETNYNVLLCYLMDRDYDRCIEKVNEIIGQAPGKYQRHFFLIRGLLYEIQGKEEKAQKDYQKYEKAEPKSFQQYFKEGKDLLFEPFPHKQRLCAKFETLKIHHLQSPLYHSKLLTKPRLLLKPSFSMPFIKPPNMIPNLDEEAIQGEFTLKQIDAPMPEAPWIRRVQCITNTTNNSIHQQNQSINAIKFTDHILMREEGDENYGQEDEDYSEDKGSDIDVSQINNEYSREELKKSKKPNKNSKQVQQEQKQEINRSYFNSIEIPVQSQTKEQVGISEQILKTQQNPNSFNLPSAMMVYQFVGGQGGNGVNLDGIDEISDKHKISLFDDSRYEGDNLNNYSSSLVPGPSDEYQNTSNKPKNTKNRKQRILTSSKTGQDTFLHGGDSLYDEQLLDELNKHHDDGDVQFAEYGKPPKLPRQSVLEDEDDPDSSSESSSDYSSGVEEERQSGKNKNQVKEEVKSSYPQVDDSMVILGDNKASKRKRRQEQHQQQQQRLVISTDLRPPNSKRPQLNNDPLNDSEDEEGGGTNGRDSIFRSRQSSKR